jgi:hypothetical protein
MGIKWLNTWSYALLVPEFLSYEEYISHVFEKHEDQPSVRMQAKIIKDEVNET